VEDPNLALAQELDMEVCHDLPQSSVSPDLIPHAFLNKHSLLPLREEGRALVVALSDPLDIESTEELRLLLKREIEPVYCPKELLLPALKDYAQSGGTASELLAEMGGEGAEEEVEVFDLVDSESAAPIVRLINRILTEAIEQGASDIHFEPLENDLRVRYRIDGVLQNRHAPPRAYQSQLMTRLKVMARLDIAEHRLPQDGRIKLRSGGREIDLRVSTLPVSGGERIVLRILDRGNIVIGLEKLGMPSDTLTALRRLTSLPEGILLVTGPTGSGKTTTLYSALTEIDSEAINIMTIEDPVEYKLSGVAQIGVRPKIGLTFAAGLRHILRQDPDVIMVGEIRDRETAEIAIQAALTGHLVLSTLHTNDAPSALTRLVDMGIEPYLLSSTVVGVLAQRLVRTLCQSCNGAGCLTCFNSGYKGRHGLYELMPITHPLKQQVLKSADASRLRQTAVKEGMQTLADNGQALIDAGITTREEVLRVTRGI
jgi:general secretion pathway protein E